MIYVVSSLFSFSKVLKLCTFCKTSHCAGFCVYECLCHSYVSHFLIYILQVTNKGLVSAWPKSSNLRAGGRSTSHHIQFCY